MLISPCIPVPQDLQAHPRKTKQTQNTDCADSHGWENPDQRFSLSTTCRQGERLGCGEGERGIEGFITIYLGRRGLASSGAAPVEARGGEGAGFD